MNLTMNLSEIIETNEIHTISISTEQLIKYKKSLLVYYTDLFCCEPILMVTDVFNVGSFAKIVPSSEFNEAIYAYMGVPYIEQDENEEGFNEDLFAQYETINFNSIFLKQL